MITRYRLDDLFPALRNHDGSTWTHTHQDLVRHSHLDHPTPIREPRQVCVEWALFCQNAREDENTRRRSPTEYK